MRRWIVAVIGDSSTSQDDERYLLARKLGKALIDNNYRIISGGLGGIMQAVSEGARESENYKEGDILGILPGFDPDEANSCVDIPIATGLNYSRNTIVANSDAVIAIGGGSGTLSEMAHAWAMRRLVIAYKVRGWSGELADRKLDERHRYPDMADDRIYGVTTEKETISILRNIGKYNRRIKGIRKRK